MLMQVWVTMFARLLKDPLVPAIVVPEGYPNESTWKLLRQSVPTEVTGSILTCQHDISAEWRTYYDYRWVTVVATLIQYGSVEDVCILEQWAVHTSEEFSRSCVYASLSVS